jgi:hypothetical protein
LELLAEPSKDTKTTVAVFNQPGVGESKDELVKDKSLNDIRRGKLNKIPLPAKPTGEITLYFDDNSMDDLWLAMTWSKEVGMIANEPG